MTQQPRLTLAERLRRRAERDRQNGRMGNYFTRRILADEAPTIRDVGR